MPHVFVEGSRQEVLNRLRNHPSLEPSPTFISRAQDYYDVIDSFLRMGMFKSAINGAFGEYSNIGDCITHYFWNTKVGPIATS